MAHFVIDDFDFGIDEKRSSVKVAETVFHLKIVGAEAIIANVMASEDHPWNWLIQPPFLYAINVPCQVDLNGDFEHDITEHELDDYDIALYAMEHCDVNPCHIAKKGKVVTVVGKVHCIQETPVDLYAAFEVP